jgi:hypothetical protein
MVLLVFMGLVIVCQAVQPIAGLAGTRGIRAMIADWEEPRLKENDMLLDVRTYTCRPGTIKKHLALYEKLGKGPQTRHLGQPFAYLVTETGNVNQYIHIWAYENAGDRERRRAAMWADPEWIAYTEESAKLGALDQQENRLMTPVAFFPLQR